MRMGPSVTPGPGLDSCAAYSVVTAVRTVVAHPAATRRRRSFLFSDTQNQPAGQNRPPDSARNGSLALPGATTGAEQRALRKLPCGRRKQALRRPPRVGRWRAFHASVTLQTMQVRLLRTALLLS